MEKKYELNTNEMQSLKVIEECYAYIEIFKEYLDNIQIAGIEAAIKRELLKFRDSEIAEDFRLKIRAKYSKEPRKALFRVPLKLGDKVKINAMGKEIVGTVTRNPNSVKPYDEPNSNIDSYIYYIDGSPVYVDNQPHTVEILDTMKGYKVPRLVF